MIEKVNQSHPDKGGRQNSRSNKLTLHTKKETRNPKG